MLVLLYVLGWLCNITATFLFGIVLVPLGAFAASPWLGAIITILSAVYGGIPASCPLRRAGSPLHERLFRSAAFGKATREPVAPAG